MFDKVMCVLKNKRRHNLEIGFKQNRKKNLQLNQTNLKRDLEES